MDPLILIVFLVGINLTFENLKCTGCTGYLFDPHFSIIIPFSYFRTEAHMNSNVVFHIHEHCVTCNLPYVD